MLVFSAVFCSQQLRFLKQLNILVLYSKKPATISDSATSCKNGSSVNFSVFQTIDFFCKTISQKKLYSFDTFKCVTIIFCKKVIFFTTVFKISQWAKIRNKAALFALQIINVFFKKISNGVCPKCLQELSRFWIL